VRFTEHRSTPQHECPRVARGTGSLRGGLLPGLELARGLTCSGTAPQASGWSGEPCPSCRTTGRGGGMRAPRRAPRPGRVHIRSSSPGAGWCARSPPRTQSPRWRARHARERHARGSAAPGEEPDRGHEDSEGDDRRDCTQQEGLSVRTSAASSGGGCRPRECPGRVPDRLAAHAAVAGAARRWGAALGAGAGHEAVTRNLGCAQRHPDSVVVRGSMGKRVDSTVNTPG
jgi:hypothetical protein